MKHKKHFGTTPWLCAAGAALLLLVVCACLVLGWMEEPEPRMEAVPDNTYEDTLVIAADLDYQPYSFVTEQGEPAGYDIELIYLLANAMGRNVEVRLMQWVDAQAAIRSGEADILMGLDYNVDALREYELSLPLDSDPFVAFGKQDLVDVGEFYNKKIATLACSGSFTAFLTPYRLEGQTTTYDSYSEAFRSVERGENDYAIAMYSVGRRAIANLGGSEMRAVGPVLAGNYLCIGTRKGNTALMEELNQAIIRLKLEGTVDSLGEKWLGRYVEVISTGDFLKENVLLLVLLAAFVLLSAALVYGFFSRRLAKSTHLQHELTKRMLAYQQFLAEATKGLYENILEVNITQNRIEGESTRQYYESLGIPPDTPFDEALRIIARTQIEERFSQGYLDTFSVENVLRAYQSGQDSLSYEFMVRNKEGESYWMRVTARIFCWKEDDTVRMITYRVNIDNEKRKEQELEEKVREDALTGLLNKVTTGAAIRETLARAQGGMYAFVMLDVDDFKVVNDSFGHAFGDLALIEFANELKNSAGGIEGAIVGRIGGDEFTMLLPYDCRETLEEETARLVRGLSRTITVDATTCHISASIGIALCPQDGTDFESLYHKADAAMYRSKKNGKNGYTFYGSGDKGETG